jgi:penicillin-binding protein 1A
MAYDIPQHQPVPDEPSRSGRLSPRRMKERIRGNLRSPDRRKGTIAVLVLAGLMTLFLLYYVVLIYQLPTVKRLQNARIAEASIVYTTDGVELTRYHTENRTWVSLDSISPNVTNALIATEDHRFYDHWGVDVQRTISSVFKTVQGDMQGGSTITMQLARNAFTEIQDDAALTRKFKEWITALRIEQMYEKDEILEMYLNTVPYLYNAFGIEAAARTYFQKSALDLDVMEAASLVGMLKGTAFYNPQRNPERSHERRNVVFEQMVKHGYLSQAEFEEMRDTPTELNFRPMTHKDNLAPYFAEHLRQWLGEWAEQRGINLYKDGLRIYSTIDAELQNAATEAATKMGSQLQAVANVEWSGRQSPYFSSNAADYVSYQDNVSPFAYFWESNPSMLNDFIKTTDEYRQAVRSGMPADSALARFRADESFVDSVKAIGRRLEVGFVAIEPHTGYVKAWVGGRSFEEDQYDHVALAKRQPGSTFKPFVYTAAIESGYSPEDQVRDEVVEYVDPDTRRVWRPENVGSSSGAMMTLRDALAYSKNTITAQLVQELGPNRVANYAHRMGIQSELDEVPSIGLGTSDVTLLELTTAYVTLANGGNYAEPVFVTRIEDRNGNVLATFGPDVRQALSAHTAYTVLDMLRGVVDYGTGQRIRATFGARGDLAGKTGTTQNGADGWFMLMHPNLVMGSWVGFKNPSIAFRSSYWGQGSHNALYVVGNFVREAGLPPSEFSAPPGYSAPGPSANMMYAEWAEENQRIADSLALMADSLAGDRWTYDRWDYQPSEYNPDDPYGLDGLGEDDEGFAEGEDEEIDIDLGQMPVDESGGEQAEAPPAEEPETPVEELSEIDQLNRQAREGSAVQEQLERIRGNGGGEGGEGEED